MYKVVNIGNFVYCGKTGIAQHTNPCAQDIRIPPSLIEFHEFSCKHLTGSVNVKTFAEKDIKDETFTGSQSALEKIQLAEFLFRKQEKEHRGLP